MKNVLVGMLLASVFIVPAQADNNSRHRGSSGGSDGGGTGSGAAPSASSTSTATGGAGGAGGNGTGGAATGGSATGGNATGGAATGGRSNANGNTSTVSVSLTNSGGGASASGGSDPNAATTVRYDGSYTVKSAPPIAAPSLTSTFSDTCMGSSSFGLSFVGFGATGGTTMVDEACVRRLDSREFRAMGLNDVALALLCQSAANKKAVEATGRACPAATESSSTASAKSSTTLASINNQASVDQQQASLSLAPETPLPVAALQAPQAPQPPQALELPQQPVDSVAATPEPVPDQAKVEALEIQPLSDEAGGK